MLSLVKLRYKNSDTFKTFQKCLSPKFLLIAYRKTE